MQGRQTMHAMNRRRFLATAGAATLLPSLLPARVRGQETTRPSETLTPTTQTAVDRGLTWLAKRQLSSGGQKGAFGQGGYQGGVAVCSLGGLAMMCSGSAPGQGPFGKNIDRCAEFLCTCVGDTGYISQPNYGQDNMYGHGFGTLFLSEYYGMSDRPDLDATVGEKLRKAVKLTCECQNDVGGWRYEPRKSDADLSITICNIMGLRAARDAGIHVPDPVRNKCIDYVKKSQNSDGGFRYQISQGGGSTFPLTAAGVVSLYSAGIYDGEQVEKALGYLMRYMPGNQLSNTGYFFYGHYYAVQAMWHAGGKLWRDWYPAIRDELVARQHEDGSWTDAICMEYGTAMACIVLQIPNNYLPIFQR
jgi:hypothetical protein